MLASRLEVYVFQNLVKISVRSYQDIERVEPHGKISSISSRCRKSRRELDKIMARSQQSRRDGGNFAEIQKFTNIMLRSRRDLGHLGEMEDISPWSRRDLESRKHRSEISTISARSRQDGEYLATISQRFRILQTSWRDLGKNFARVNTCTCAKQMATNK